MRASLQDSQLQRTDEEKKLLNAKIEDLRHQVRRCECNNVGVAWPGIHLDMFVDKQPSLNTSPTVGSRERPEQDAEEPAQEVVSVLESTRRSLEHGHWAAT